MRCYMIDYRNKSKTELLKIIRSYRQGKQVSFDACSSAILEYVRRAYTETNSPIKRKNLLETLQNYLDG